MASGRTKGITIKVTDDEYATLARLAHRDRPSAAWVHEVLLATADAPSDRPRRSWPKSSRSGRSC